MGQEALTPDPMLPYLASPTKYSSDRFTILIVCDPTISVYLEIPYLNQLFSCIIIDKFPIIHLMTLLYQLLHPLQLRQLNLIFLLSSVKIYTLLVIPHLITLL